MYYNVYLNSKAITNITRNGTTFTATRANGSTFTFTQQDHNSVTTIESNAYSSSSISFSSSAKQFTITATKSGWTPIAYSGPYYGNSAVVNCGVESVTWNAGSVKLAGYAKTIGGESVTMTFSALVTWVKHS